MTLSPEEQVRRRWEHVHVCDGSYREYREGTVLLQGVPGLWSSFDSFSSALAFTLKREEEIREVEQEIKFVKIILIDQNRVCGVESCGCEDPFKRILSRLEAILADLKRGWRE